MQVVWRSQKPNGPPLFAGKWPKFARSPTQLTLSRNLTHHTYRLWVCCKRAVNYQYMSAVERQSSLGEDGSSPSKRVAWQTPVTIPGATGAALDTTAQSQSRTTPYTVPSSRPTSQRTSTASSVTMAQPAVPPLTGLDQLPLHSTSKAHSVDSYSGDKERRWTCRRCCCSFIKAATLVLIALGFGAAALFVFFDIHPLPINLAVSALH